jgi:uncharacterized membrane-anchored protein
VNHHFDSGFSPFSAFWADFFFVVPIRAFGGDFVAVSFSAGTSAFSAAFFFLVSSRAFGAAFVAVFLAAAF